MKAPTPPQIIGVGFGLAIIADVVTIVYIVPGTPAFRAGLVPGLIVQTIDGTSTKGMQQKDWHQKLRGEVGTAVTLEVIDVASKQTKVVELVRESFEAPASLPESAMLRT